MSYMNLEDKKKSNKKRKKKKKETFEMQLVGDNQMFLEELPFYTKAMNQL